MNSQQTADDLGSTERENTCIKGKRNNMFCEKEILFVNKHSERNKPHDAKRRESAMRQGREYGKQCLT